MKRPGTQDREPRRSKQNSTGTAGAKTQTRGKATAARKASAARHARAGDVVDTRQNGASRTTGGRKAHA